jgi:hypothetical protein
VLAEAVITDNMFGRLVWQLHLAERDGANAVAVLRELAEEIDFLDEQRPGIGHPIVAAVDLGS